MTRAPRTADRDVLTLQEEFGSMPALVLDAPQTARLLAIPLERATRMLAAAEQEGWLIRLPTGRYRRAEPLLT